MVEKVQAYKSKRGTIYATKKEAERCDARHNFLNDYALCELQPESSYVDAEEMADWLLENRSLVLGLLFFQHTEEES